MKLRDSLWSDRWQQEPAAPSSSALATQPPLEEMKVVVPLGHFSPTNMVKGAIEGG